jgi:hypothetical protein
MYGEGAYGEAAYGETVGALAVIIVTGTQVILAVTEGVDVFAANILTAVIPSISAIANPAMVVIVVELELGQL